jgi:hypothetical protein
VAQAAPGSTYWPFGAQMYFNGHNPLATKLLKAGIEYRMLDNAFTYIADWEAAQKWPDESDTRLVHEKLDSYARSLCPAIETLGLTYEWTLAQVEYATDVVFRRQADLQPIYETLVRTAVHAVKPPQIATFLGRKYKLNSNNTEEIGNDFDTRIHGTRVKHRIGPTSIKMYDKAGLILRIETTTNDPRWFHHYRTVARPRRSPRWGCRDRAECRRPRRKFARWRPRSAPPPYARRVLRRPLYPALRKLDLHGLQFRRGVRGDHRGRQHLLLRIDSAAVGNNALAERIDGFRFTSSTATAICLQRFRVSTGFRRDLRCVK